MLETIQRESVISFPMLGGLTLNPPSYFTVFGRPVYFYGVLIGLGFLLGILLCAKRAPRFGLKEDDVYDAVLWLIPCSILGARLYYVAFRLDYYLQQVKPTYVVICLCSNELFVRDLDQREEYIKTIISKIGNVPFVWISPPNWKDDTGIHIARG